MGQEINLREFAGLPSYVRRKLYHLEILHKWLKKLVALEETRIAKAPSGAPVGRNKLDLLLAEVAAVSFLVNDYVLLKKAEIGRQKAAAETRRALLPPGPACADLQPGPTVVQAHGMVECSITGCGTLVPGDRSLCFEHESYSPSPIED